MLTPRPILIAGVSFGRSLRPVVAWRDVSVPRALGAVMSIGFALGVGVVMLDRPNAISLLALGTMLIGHVMASMLLERPRAS